MYIVACNGTLCSDAGVQEQKHAYREEGFYYFIILSYKCAGRKAKALGALFQENKERNEGKCLVIRQKDREGGGGGEKV